MQLASLLSEPLDGLIPALVPGLDLQALAHEKKAILRSRKLGDARHLLRLAWLYGPGGLSLRSTASWAVGSGLAALSDVAVLKALRRMADWMETLVNATLSARHPPGPDCDRPIVLIDATNVSQPGSVGSDWVLHCRYQAGVGFTGFEVTDRHGGERLARHPLRGGELVLGDRAYARGGAGLAYVVDHGADYLVRTGWRSLALRDLEGEPFDLFAHLARLHPGDSGDFPVQVAVGKRLLATRLVVLALDEEAVSRSLRRVRRKAQKNCRKNDPRTVVAARYVLVVTSLDADRYPTAEVLALYRLRWQIELAFKRLKSLLHIDRLPAKDKDLARTWLYAHLLFALAIDQMTQQMLDSPPCAGRHQQAAAVNLAPSTAARRYHARIHPGLRPRTP